MEVGVPKSAPFFLVLKDIDDFKLNLKIDDIQNLRKKQIKKIVKDAMKKVAFEYLCKEKDTSQKSKLKSPTHTVETSKPRLKA